MTAVGLLTFAECSLPPQWIRDPRHRGTERWAKLTGHRHHHDRVDSTEPYFLDSASSTSGGIGNHGMMRTDVDLLGRPTSVYTADSRGSQSAIGFAARGIRPAAWTRIRYGALVTVTTNDLGQVRQDERNIDGRLVRITDALGAQLVHQHDAFGNLMASKDALQNTITLHHDLRGRKIYLIDPDAGVTGHCYDALGQLKYQQNTTMRGSNALAACPDIAVAGTTATATATATAGWTAFAHDPLGRLSQRIEPEATSTWRYDACTTGIGKLCQTVHNDVARKHVYDPWGRLINTRTDITGGPSFAAALSYDPTNARLIKRSYPSGLAVNHGYTPKGFLAELSLATPASVSPLPAIPGGSTGSSEALPALQASDTAPPALSSVVLVKVEYWHQDHLGSLVGSTDHQGAVTACCLSYIGRVGGALELPRQTWMSTANCGWDYPAVVPDAVAALVKVIGDVHSGARFGPLRYRRAATKKKAL